MSFIDFVAGCIGGAAGVLSGHPFDTIKVRLQTQTDGRYRGTFHCFTSIIKREGPLGLYKGMSSPLAGLAFINAIGFGVYGNVLACFKDKTAIHAHLIAGCSSGFAQAIINAPMELVKLRVQIQGPNNSLTNYRSPYHCLQCTYNNSGIRGIYRGITLTMLRDCPALATYFTSYEIMARRLSKDGTLESLTGPQLLSAGGIAGMLSWLINYPTDVLKTRFQADGTDPSNCKYRNLRDCLRKTYAQGWRTFFYGLTSTMLRAFPTNAATFFTVEWTFRIYEMYLLPKWKKVEKPVQVEIEIDHQNYAGDEWLLLPEAGSTMLDPSVDDRVAYSHIHGAPQL